MSVDEQYILGGAALDALLGTLPVNIEKNIMRGALRAGAKVFLAVVKQNIPMGMASESERQQGFRPGALRRSARITTRVRKGEVTASVKVGGINKKTGENVYYAGWVEYGTRPHLIKVQDSERGVNRRTGKALSYTTINRNVLIIGNTFVGPTVEHPGARARPFMRPAADAGFEAAVNAVQVYVRKHLTKEGLTIPEPTPADEAAE